MLGLAVGCMVGPTRLIPWGSRSAIGPGPREGLALPVVCLESALTRAGGVSAPPCCVLCLALSFLPPFRSLCV